MEHRLVTDRDPRSHQHRQPGSACRTQLSWILVSSPMTMGALSARSTAPGHTLARAPIVTAPMITAPCHGRTHSDGSADEARPGGKRPRCAPRRAVSEDEPDLACRTIVAADPAPGGPAARRAQRRRAATAPLAQFLPARRSPRTGTNVQDLNSPRRDRRVAVAPLIWTHSQGPASAQAIPGAPAPPIPERPLVIASLRSWVRGVLRVRTDRKLARRGAKPPIGATIVFDDLRMTVQAGFSDDALAVAGRRRAGAS